MSAIAIDVGKARIGVAFNVGELVLAHGVIPRNEGSIASLAEIAAERGAERIFVGLPLKLSGESSATTMDSVAVARELADVVAVPVLLIDERLTTKSASAALREAGLDARSGKSVVDAESARIILETALRTKSAMQLEEFDA